MCVNMYVRMYVHTYICTYVYVHTHMLIHTVCMYVYICVCVCTCHMMCYDLCCQFFVCQNNRSLMAKEAKKAAKLEKKLKILTDGYRVSDLHSNQSICY